MRIINSEGFSDEERLAIKVDIAANIVSAIQTLLANSVGDWAEAGLEDDVNAVESLPQRPNVAEVREHAERIEKLWNHPIAQEAYERRNRFQLVECAKYFLSKVSEVLEEEFMPSDQDIVHTRVKTTGIIEHDFHLSSGGGEKPRKLIFVIYNFF